MQDKWLLAVTAGKWQVHGIKKAREMGYKVLAIDSDKHAEGFLHSDLSLNVDTNDVQLVLSHLREMNLNIGGAISFCSEAGMLLCAHIREKFSLPGPHIELTQSLINKKVQREIWRRSNISGPVFSVFTSVEECLAQIEKNEKPCIIKPVDSAGSRGVSKIEQSDANISEKVHNAFKFSKTGEVILESYMDGTEFTVETFCDRNGIHVLCVTEKKKIPTTGGVVAYELATSGRDPKQIKILEDLVIAAFKALGYRHGPGHAEVILMKNDVAGVVEVAGRGGGFNLFNRFIPLVSGYDLVGNTIKVLMGEDTESVGAERKHGVLRFFPTRAGIIKSISGFDEPQEKDIFAEPFVKVGQTVGDANSDGDRMGCIITVDQDLSRAFAKADIMDSKIKFDIGVINESH